MKNVDAERRERARVISINELGRVHQRRDLADTAILHGWTAGQFERELLREFVPAFRPVSMVGLSPKEIRQYSLIRALASLGTDPGQLHGLEAEASEAVAKAIGRASQPGSIFVPYEIQTRDTRDLTVGIGSAGGYLVSGAEHAPGSFVGTLRNRSVVNRMGATLLPDLRGHTPLPKQNGEATGYWLSTEATETTESQQSFGEIALTPHTCGAYTEISRQLTLQASPSAEAIVQADLGAVVGVAVDAAAINGSGASGQPTGILNTGSTGSVTGTSIAFAGLLEFQHDVLDANALINSGTCGYVTTPTIAQTLAARQRFTGTDAALWEGNLANGVMAGFPAMSSKQVPASTLIFGDWSTLVIGEWGVLEVGTNPFANFKAGIIGVRALYSVDIGLRHAESFSIATSVT